MSELDLLARAQAGDQEAFDELYRSTYAPVFRFVLSRIKNVDEAEDITQDVFMKFLRAVPTYQPRGSMLSYLLAAARNTIIDHLRRKKPDYDDDALFNIAADDPSAEQVSALGEESAYALQCLAKLSPGEQEVVRLKCLDGLSTEEISTTVGKSEEAVRQLLSRGLKHIRILLERVNQFQ